MIIFIHFLLIHEGFMNDFFRIPVVKKEKGNDTHSESEYFLFILPISFLICYLKYKFFHIPTGLLREVVPFFIWGISILINPKNKFLKISGIGLLFISLLAFLLGLIQLKFSPSNQLPGFLPYLAYGTVLINAPISIISLLFSLLVSFRKIETEEIKAKSSGSTSEIVNFSTHLKILILLAMLGLILWVASFFLNDIFKALD